ncbi:hypothetical protein NKH52_09270 [Mesorhizobium sp. M1066]
MPEVGFPALRKDGFIDQGGGDLLDPVCNMVVSLAPAENIIAAWRESA